MLRTSYRIYWTLTLIPLVALMAFVDSWAAGAEAPWIIDTHTHFKSRAQIAHEAETTKRDPRNTLGHVVAPEDYRELADRLAIRSTVIVEAVEQDQEQFNTWVLDQAKSDLVCGYVARGDLASPGFLENYRRYGKSGYLKGYRFRFEELHGYLSHEVAREHLKILERDGMVIDLLIEPAQASDAARLAREFPQLKIVINHCFRARLTDGKVSEEWAGAIETCAAYPNVFCKISSILNFAGTEAFGSPAPTGLDTYLPVLEPCFKAFGENRVIFATNWGVCTHYGRVDDVVRIVKEFLQTKGESAVDKGMRDNALRLYRISEEHLR